MNMIGHLEPAERNALWRRLGERLAPGAPLVVSLQEPYDEARVVPRMRVAELAVGDRRYECYGSAEPTGPESVRWSMEYRTLDGDTVLTDSMATFDWWVVTPGSVLAGFEEVGLRAVTADAGLVVGRKPA